MNTGKLSCMIRRTNNTVQIIGLFKRLRQDYYHNCGCQRVVSLALYTVFQIPGYYKYGSIKGRVFMYIPVAGFLLTLSLFSKILSIGTSVIATVGNSPVLLAILVITLFIVMYALSSWFSIWIMKTRKYK